jgi:hypothetical protein
MNRAWRIASCAAFVAVAMPAGAQTPTPAPSGDEQAYKDAMECKVRLEALELTAGDARERKRLHDALTYWEEKERAAGTKLGKDAGTIMADEIFVGLAEASSQDSLRRALVCAQQAMPGPAGP